MIYAKPSGSFRATVEDAPTGLVGTLGVRIERGDGTTAVARHTTGIIEIEAGSGIYAATITAPATASPPNDPYIVLWDTGGGSPSFAQEPLTVTPAPPIVPGGIEPALTDVGAVLRARTRSDATGTETGTFDSHTRPTGDEVVTFIASALTEVRLWLPDDIPDRVQPYVKHLIALRAAMLVEISNDSDRAIGNPDSTYSQLKQMYDDGKAALLDSLDDQSEGVTRRISSLPVISPTLAPFPDEVRAAMTPVAWPWP